MKKAVIGIASTTLQAEAIVVALREAGFSGEDISVLFPDKSAARDFAHELGTKAPEGAIAGVGAGGAVGGTLGLLAGIGAIAIPGLGPFIAAGPIMAALGGAAAGAAVGGITGALIGMGIPELEAKAYEGKLRGGNILMSVHVESTAERARAEYVLETHGATQILTLGEVRAA
ncbi:Succinyl-CoA ligase [ADP-forming] beta chain [Minicystis rosea]|nr:Succinyl-CoA ligase [ADP-forming] beta chain [Minicystis rosea]